MKKIELLEDWNFFEAGQVFRRDHTGSDTYIPIHAEDWGVCVNGGKLEELIGDGIACWINDTVENLAEIVKELQKGTWIQFGDAPVLHCLDQKGDLAFRTMNNKNLLPSQLKFSDVLDYAFSRKYRLYTEFRGKADGYITNMFTLDYQTRRKNRSTWTKRYTEAG